MTSGLQEALRTDEAGLRSFGRERARASDSPGLRDAAASLMDHLPPSKGLPWAACFFALGKAPEKACELYERWLKDAEAPSAFHLGQLCKTYQRLGDPAGVFRTAARFHPWDLEYEPRVVAARALKKVRGENAPAGVRTFRVALISSFTPASIESCLRVGMAGLGLDLEWTAGGFPELRANLERPDFFAPDVVVLAATWRDLRRDGSAADWKALWDLLMARTSAHILQHTFDRPAVSAMGHRAFIDTKGIRRQAARTNDEMAEDPPPRVTLVDHEQAVYRFGCEAWDNRRGWYWTKTPLADRAVPHLVEEYVAVLRALTGKTRKVLVLDLDNTLWGGVVGEDGIENLSVGPPSPEGEAHQDFQRYCRALKDRGVLLAVCSKNGADDARRPFETIPEMVLRLDDFVAFETGWDPKHEILRKLAEKLELGLDSFVFTDDDPRERALVRRECPEVLVIPLSGKPYEYVEILDRARAFEALSISPEDWRRTQDYQAQEKRRALRERVGSLEDYYASLEMVATLHPFRKEDVNRIVQLAARTNQFNLTSWRLTVAEVEKLMTSPVHETRTLRLRDRFGDYGLVAVLIGEVKGKTLEILQWLMSCRVIGRSVEQTLLAAWEAMAIGRGCELLEGVYHPTPKNGVVKDLYPHLGFEDCENSRWRRRVDCSNPIRNPAIREEETHP